MLHRELVFLPSNHLIVGVSGGIMCRPYKRPRLQQLGEISELIFDTDSDEARLSRDVSSVQGRFERVSGLSQPQPYRQQPVVTSPAVQFPPVPLKKRTLVRMGQVNRLNSQ